MRIVFGILMAFGEESVRLIGVPLCVPAPVQMLVPGCRTTPLRPGSMVKVIVEGAYPLEWLETTPALGLAATVYVSRPAPRLLIFSVPEATPRLQSSIARNTMLVSGIRIGYWYRFPSGRWIIPESLNPQAFAPSLVIAILATMLSGRLMPRRIPRFVGSLTSSVEDSEGEGGLVVAAVLNALYRVAPSGEKMLPPTFCVVFTADVKVNGALALFCCATTASVAVSYMVNPAMKREPSGAIEITVLCPAVVRLRRITPEATS